MSATLAKSAAPPWALTCWVDDKGVYIEIPASTKAKSPAPYVMRFAHSEQGLSKALNILRDKRNTAAMPMYRADDAATFPVTLVKRAGTVQQQRTAANVLRKLGMIP